MPAIPLCANARDEAPASRQTTVNAIIEREAVMPKVAPEAGPANGASRRRVAQGEAPAITNEYVASRRVVDAHPQGPVQPGAKFRERRCVASPFVVRDRWSTVRAVKVMVQQPRRLTVAFSARHGSQKSMRGTSQTWPVLVHRIFHFRPVAPAAQRALHLSKELR